MQSTSVNGCAIICALNYRCRRIWWTFLPSTEVQIAVNTGWLCIFSKMYFV